MARNEDVSIESKGWHPHQLIAQDAEYMFLEYKKYRQILIEELQNFDSGINNIKLNQSDLAHILDIAHLTYLGPFLNKTILNHIISEKLLGKEFNEIISSIWHHFVTGTKSTRFRHNTYNYPPNKFVENKRRILLYLCKFLQGIGLPHSFIIRNKWLSPYMDLVYTVNLNSKVSRKYRFYDEFLYPELLERSRKKLLQYELNSILNHLNKYI